MKIKIYAKRFVNGYVIEENGKEVGRILKSFLNPLKFSETFTIKYKGKEWKLERKILSGEVVGDNLRVRRKKTVVFFNDESVNLSIDVKGSMIEYNFPDGSSVRLYIRTLFEDILVVIKGKLLFGEVECKNEKDTKKLLFFFILEHLL